jgi:hypothetical protein
MNTVSYRNPKAATQETRSRVAELYFNGACLVRSILRLRFRHVPFFLLHLSCALISLDSQREAPAEDQIVGIVRPFLNPHTPNLYGQMSVYELSLVQQTPTNSNVRVKAFAIS